MTSSVKNPFDKQSPLTGVSHIIAVGSGKGGVGKSTVALNLALALKKFHSCQVGVLDADLYGPSLPRMTGCLKQKPSIDSQHGKVIPLKRYGLHLMSMGFLIEEETPVIWRGPMLFKAVEQLLRDVLWGKLDFLIVDLPPGTGDVALTLAQKVKVAGALVVCTPQNIALADAKKALQMFQQLQIPTWGVVENMSHLRIPSQEKTMDLFPKGQLDLYLKTQGVKKLVSLPFEPHIGLACESGVPFLETETDSESGKAFLLLSQQIMQKT